MQVAAPNKDGLQKSLTFSNCLCYNSAAVVAQRRLCDPQIILTV